MLNSDQLVLVSFVILVFFSTTSFIRINLNAQTERRQIAPLSPAQWLCCVMLFAHANPLAHWHSQVSRHNYLAVVLNN